MNPPVIIRPPSRFVGIHAHSGFSVNDGFGFPADHINFVLENEMDAWTITDHGNANGHAHAHKHAASLKKKGKKYRQLYGVEFYFVPSLKQWRMDYDSRHEEKEDVKVSLSEDPGEEGGLVVEDENESKSATVRVDEWKRRYHLVVLARDIEGLKNIYRLVKRSYTEGFYRYPRIDFDMLKEHGKGLVVSTACIGGIFANRTLRAPVLHTPQADLKRELLSLTDRFVDAVGQENFYYELQFNKLDAQHTVNKQLIELSSETGVKLISTADSHYYRPDLWQARELYKRLGWMKNKNESENDALPTKDELKCELYPKNAPQMWDEFLAARDQHDFYVGHEELVRDSIERTHDIAWDFCQDMWIDTKAKLPNFSTNEQTATQQLYELSQKSLVEMKLADKPEYVERMNWELDIIQKKGFESYFLTLNKIFHLAEQRALMGAGRGSAGGSLINYLLGISHVDPLKYNLLFERFLGIDRDGWPDIDTDCSDRDVMIDAARELFGVNSVIPVSNFNTLKLKGLIKDVSKYFKVPFDEVNAVTYGLDFEVEPHAKDENMEKSMFVLKHEDCMEYSEKYAAFMEKYPTVKEFVELLGAQNKSVGRHASGVIVCPDLESEMPLITVKGELQTPWTEGVNIRLLEENGFLKFDFLGIDVMKIVEICIKLILRKEGNPQPTFLQVKEYFDKNLNCRFNEVEDKKVFKYVYEDGRFVAMFQFESDGARRLCTQAAPTSIEELAAITAIYRPGPLKAKVHIKYVEARAGGEVKYEHPVIEEVLGVTYGFIVFQEQFMILAQKVAGFTPGESDKMRKTLVKKDMDSLGKKNDEREALREKFINGAIKTIGMNKVAATTLFEKIEYFSLYGFNKSHSVAYAIDSYYGAWLMKYHEKEYLAACLQQRAGGAAGEGDEDAKRGNNKKLPKVISEIKQMGYPFGKVDVNFSFREWSFSEEVGAFLPPISFLKKVGDAAVQEIMQNRPYKNLNDLLYDGQGVWRHSKVNKSTLDALCRAEALNSLEEFKNGKITNHKQLYEIIIGNYDVIKKGDRGMTKTAIKKIEKTCQIVPKIVDVLIEKVQDVADWEREEKIAFQEELMSDVDTDLLVSEELVDRFQRKGVAPITSIGSNKKVICWFIARSTEEKTTKTGKPYHVIIAQDDDNRKVKLKVWGGLREIPPNNSVWMCEANGDEQWGPSTSAYKMRKVT